MKKLVLLIFTLYLVFTVPMKAQTFGFEMKLDNFEQVSEYKFQFEAYIRKMNTSDPIGIEVFQFQLVYDAAILNGGIFHSDYLEFDNSGSDLEGAVANGLFLAQNGNRLLYSTDDVGVPGSLVAVLGDDWSYIGLFSVSLTKDGEYHNFGSADANIGFRADPGMTYTIVTRCDYTGSPGNYIKDGVGFYPVNNRTLYPEDGEPMDIRQLAGYWYYGNGDWDVVANWNTVLKGENAGYTQELPGANANAIINGNVSIPDGLDVSLLPDVDGNGGEVTVLTGSEPLYTILLVPNGNNVSARLFDAGFVEISNPSTLQAGTELYFGSYSTGFGSGTFVNWTDQDNNVIANTNEFGPYFMPANNVTLTANWTSGTKSILIPGNSKELYAGLTIVPGASLTVDKLFNDNENGAEAILVQSDATGSGYLIHNNSGVLATVERYLSGEIYHYVSPPVSDQDYTLLTGTLGTDDYFIWDEPTQNWINLNHPDNQPPPDGTDLVPGKGYAVAYASGDLTKSFEGTLNTGLIEINATRISTEPLQGFNLVGNPYPAAISADDFIAANLTLDGGLYFWDETDDYDGVRWDYATYTLLGGTQAGGAGNEPNGFIAPTQGFMILVQSTADIVFDNDMRVTDFAHFFKADEEKSRVWLSVVGPEEDYNEILVGYHPQGEAGVDRSDAVKFSGNPKLALYTVLEEKDFVIQGLPPFDPTLGYIFPVGLHAGFIGDYTFKARKIENFDSEIEIILEDRLTGVMFDLRGSGEYIATIADDGIVADRFFLHINGSTSVPVIFGEKLTSVYALNSQIHIYSTSAEIVDVEVVNTLGQIIARTPVNAMETSITVPGHNVVYIVKVRTSEGVESHKLLIR